MSNGRFKGMFDAVKDETPKSTKTTKPKTEVKKKNVPPPPSNPDESNVRTTGKSSNPNYTQALAYVKKDTYKAVKRELLDKDDLDFSELVESLLNEWLIKQK
jgi:hypothetical protein